MFLFGLVLGRWWKVTVPLAAVTWPLLLVLSDIDLDRWEAAAAAILGMANAGVGAALYLAAAGLSSSSSARFTAPDPARLVGSTGASTIDSGSLLPRTSSHDLRGHLPTSASLRRSAPTCSPRPSARRVNHRFPTPISPSCRSSRSIRRSRWTSIEAFHLERLSGGGFRLRYAIADVAAFVDPERRDRRRSPSAGRDRIQPRRPRPSTRRCSRRAPHRCCPTARGPRSSGGWTSTRPESRSTPTWSVPVS